MEKSDILPVPRSQKVHSLPELAPFLDHVRIVSRVPGGAPYVRLPDGSVELVVRRAGVGFSISVMGTRLSPLEKRSEAHDESFLLRFKPGGAYPFFGVPLRELTDAIVPMQALNAPAEARLQRALDADTSLERALSVQRALAATLEAEIFEPAAVPAVRRALRLLADSPELPRVAALARHVGMSERHLRRAFEDVVGLTPKAYLRVLRFRRALSSARRGPVRSWSRLAQSHGYYDQAHLIAEFRALSGQTPGAMRFGGTMAGTRREPDPNAPPRTTNGSW